MTTPTATIDPDTIDPGVVDEQAVLDDIGSTCDALSVRRVFGDPYTVDGTTIIPVARVAGGAGGGAGAGTDADKGGGHGFGTGFGLGARPVGVYEIRDGHVAWKPTVDADRLAHGGQVLAAIAVICVTLVLLRRRVWRARVASGVAGASLGRTYVMTCDVRIGWMHDPDRVEAPGGHLPRPRPRARHWRARGDRAQRPAPAHRGRRTAEPDRPPGPP
ncbi:MAG: spore germination protein GerW family protein [Ilumatobacteraceae bacterium]